MQVRNDNEGIVDSKQYTGVTVMDVVAFNPNNATLKSLNYLVKDTEPAYHGLTKEEKKYGRLMFYLSSKVNGEPIRSSISFFFDSSPRTNKDGNKYQFIDKFGRTAWAVDVNSIESPYFDKDSAQNCYGIGHEQFIRFIRAWANLDKDDDSQLKKPQDIAEGKFGEVQKWFDIIRKNGNRIQVLLVVKDGYMNVYPDYFGKGGSNTLTYFKKHIEKAIENGVKTGFAFLYDFQNDLKLQVYENNNTTIGTKNTATSAGTSAGQSLFEAVDDDELF